MGLLHEVGEAVFGIDNRILKTLRDLAMRPGYVAAADMTPDDSPYMSQIRLFLAMFGLQTLLFSVFKFSEYQLISEFAANAGTQDAVIAALPDGITLAELDAATLDWYNYSLWPSLIVGTVLYIGILWMLRPSMPLRSHVAIYMTANNASYLLFFTAMMAGLLSRQWEPLFVLGVALYMLAFLWLIFRFIRRWYARTLSGAFGKMTVVIFMTLPISLAISAAQFGAIQYGVYRETGANYISLFFTAVSPETPQAQELSP